MISVFMSISLWAQVAVLDILHILDCLGQVNAGVYMFCIWVELPVQRRLCPCDSPKPGGPLTTRQPAEYKWRSGYPTPL